MRCGREDTDRLGLGSFAAPSDKDMAAVEFGSWIPVCQGTDCETERRDKLEDGDRLRPEGLCKRKGKTGEGFYVMLIRPCGRGRKPNCAASLDSPNN